MSKYVYDNIDPDSENTHAKLIRLVGTGKKVLEVGCASGYISKVLREEFGCDVTGVEIDPDDALEAKKHCTDVITGDVETMVLSEFLGPERFDVITYGDVLEHLRQPFEVLKKMRGLLKDDGYVVASMPNIAHISVILGLLEGEFEYGELGLLDEAHLRFFTKKSIQNMFRKAGYEIILWDRTVIRPEDTEYHTVAEKFPLSLLSFLGEGGDLFTYQYIVKAVPASMGEFKEIQHTWEKNAIEDLIENVGKLSKENKELSAELQNCQELLANAEDRIDALINCTSWKVTAPLRSISAALKVLVGRVNKGGA